VSASTLRTSFLLRVRFPQTLEVGKEQPQKFSVNRIRHWSLSWQMIGKCTHATAATIHGGDLMQIAQRCRPPRATPPRSTRTRVRSYCWARGFARLFGEFIWQQQPLAVQNCRLAM
jgi:hypothetical protein